MSERVAPRRRLRVALDLLLGIRARDVRSGIRFMNMRFAGLPLPQRLGALARWTTEMAWGRIPEARQWFAIDPGVSRTPFWLREGNPWEGHPWRDGEAQLPAQADVVVVGAGFGGASVAYHWSQQARGRLVLLERQAPAAGAAGRNAGFLTAAGGSYHGYYVYEPVRAHAAAVRPELDSAALDAIASGFSDSYVRALAESVAEIHETIAREGIECDVRRQGALVLADELDAPRVEAALELGAELGWEEWRRVEPDEVQRLTGIAGSDFAGLQEGTSTWHPARWVWGLVGAAITTGKVGLFTRTHVTRVSPEADGYRVVTNRGSIRARCVVNATEAHTRGVFADYLPGNDPELIRTHKSQAMYAAGGPTEMIPGRAICLPLGWFHPRQVGFMFGSDNVRVPASQATENAPSRFVTSFMCSEAIKLWPPRPFRVLHEWTGTVGQAPDKFPVVGPLMSPGVFMLGGFAGAGSAISFGAGREIVEQILGTPRPDSPWLPDLFGVARFAAPEGYGTRFDLSPFRPATGRPAG